MNGTNRRNTAVKMRMQGRTYREISESLGITRQRVLQLVRPEREAYNLVRKRANGKCENCDSPTRTGHVHHISRKVTKEAYQDPENLQYLCVSCHTSKHQGIYLYRTMASNENGKPTVLHVKIPPEIYLKLKKRARQEMRSLHSLAVYALAKFAERIGKGGKNQ